MTSEALRGKPASHLDRESKTGRDQAAPVADMQQRQLLASVKEATSTLGAWLSSLTDLLATETKLAVASSLRSLILCLVIAQALFLTLILFLLTVGLALHEAFDLAPALLALCALLLVSGLLILLRKMLVDTYQRIFPSAAIRQLCGGLSQSAAAPEDASAGSTEPSQQVSQKFSNS